MALYGDLTFDSRVRREAASLAGQGYEVTIVCLEDRSDQSDLPGVRVEVVDIPDAAVRPGTMNPFRASERLGRVIAGLAWLRRYVSSIRAWGRAAVERAGSVDAWHVHDFTGLAAIAPVRTRPRELVYDVHDLMLETGTGVRLPAPFRVMLRLYERRLARAASAIVTVNEGLAKQIRLQHPGARVAVVHNCPLRWSGSGGTSLLRDALGLGDEVPLLVYHGSLTTGRGIELILEALRERRLETVHLALLGFGPLRSALESAAAEPRVLGRVHLLDAVPPSDLLSWLSGADLGVVLHPGDRLNDYLKTPNKLFELLAAGVPILGSDLPALRAVVAADPRGPLGFLCDPASLDSVVAAVRMSVDDSPDERAALRERCRAAARERWNWETEVEPLLEIYALSADRTGGLPGPRSHRTVP